MIKTKNIYNFTKKQVVAGLGEIGEPILQLISKAGIAVGYEINPKLMNKKKFEKNDKLKTSFLHICYLFPRSLSKMSSHSIQNLNRKS